MDNFDFNITPATTFGVTFLDGTYAELLKPAKPKDGVVNDWLDQSGAERDLVDRVLASRTLTLPVMLEGASEADFILKLDAFAEWLKNAGYFLLKCYRLNRKYTLCFTDITDFKGYADHCTFNLVLIDDYPHLHPAI